MTNIQNHGLRDDLNQRGAPLPDLGLSHIPREDLACLHPEEYGDPQYTLEGWLAKIETGQV